MIHEWSKYPHPNLGIRTKYFPAVDFDVDVKSLVQELLPIADEHLGPAPVRGREGSPRVTRLYRLAGGVEPIRSYCLKFTLPQTGDAPHAIEILGDGRSTVLEGRHPKGGNYKWHNDVGPIDYGPNKLAPVTAEQLRAFVGALKEKLIASGATIISGKSGVVGTSAGGGERRKIGDPALKAINLDTLKRALGLIPCAEIRDRGDWMKLLIAAKAGSGGDEEFYEKVLLPWCLQYRDNKREYVRQLWDSIKDANLGADYIYGIADEYDSSFADHLHDIFSTSNNPPVWSTDRAVPDLPAPAVQPVARNGPIPKLMPADFDPRRLPRRPFVLGNRFMTGAVTLGVAPPGTGKSNFAIVSALAIATGQALTGEIVHRTGKVWIHNNEDGLDELYRRISGVLSHFQINFADVRDKIFVTSGLDERLVVAIKDRDIVQRTQAVADVIVSIKEQGIIHLVIDPLVSTHRGVSENSNEEIEQVAEAIRHIAHETGCSIDLVHHSIKSHAGNSESHAGDMNAARGASALIGAARIMYTLSSMSAKTATVLNIPPQLSARLVRLDPGKGNYSERDTSVRWFEKLSVDIGNGNDEVFGLTIGGDTVAVCVPWSPPAIDDHADEVDLKATSAGEVQRRRTLNFLAAEMQTDRVELSTLIDRARQEFGIEKTAARKKVMKAIGNDHRGFAQANGISYLMTIEREDPSPPNPIYVIRTVIDGAEAVAGAEATPDASPADVCPRADLVPA